MTTVPEPALVDTNVLVYALFPAMPEHVASRALLEERLVVAPVDGKRAVLTALEWYRDQGGNPGHILAWWIAMSGTRPPSRPRRPPCPSCGSPGRPDGCLGEGA
jgi:hypothetical protein